MNVEERVRRAMLGERAVVERSLQRRPTAWASAGRSSTASTARRQAGHPRGSRRRPGRGRRPRRYDLMVDRVPLHPVPGCAAPAVGERVPAPDRARGLGEARDAWAEPEDAFGDPALPAAGTRLEQRRDLRRAAWVVKLCPEAGEPATWPTWPSRYEQAAERVLVLDGAA